MISNTKEFGIGRRVRLANWHLLKAVGQAGNRRLCDAQAQAATPVPDVVTVSR